MAIAMVVKGRVEVEMLTGATQQLVQLLKARARSEAGFGGKAKIAVGVVGQPNVGKSSLINSLLRHKAANTGDRPGVTR